MVDLETCAHPPNAAILEIGAVGFHPENAAECGPVFFRRISLESCFDAGLTFDPDTLKWWTRQERVSEVFSGDVALGDALDDFIVFSEPFDQYWAKSPIFDLALLRDAMLKTGATSRHRSNWSFENRRSFRDVRTALDLAEEDPVLQWGFERSHDSVGDCLKQIEDLYNHTVFRSKGDLPYGRLSVATSPPDHILPDKKKAGAPE
jgi:hypothetical protein